MTQHSDFEINGGLDLRTPKFQVAPGRLLDCLNFEVGRVGGITRIDGFQLSDLQAHGGLIRFYNFVIPGTNSDAVAGNWDVAVEDVLTISYHGVTVATMYVAGVVSDTSNFTTIITAVSFNADELMDFDTIVVNSNSYIFGTGTWNEVIGLPPVTVVPSAYVDLIANGLDLRAGAVPGRSGSNVIGLKSYKDEVYAVRDMPVVTVNTIATTTGKEPVEGQRIYTATGTYSADVVDVAFDGGNFLSTTARAKFILTNEYGVDAQHDTEPAANSALYAAAFTAMPYMGGGPMGFRYMGGPYTGIGLTQFGTIAAWTGTTKARMFRGNEGWYPVDLLREVKVSGGGAALEDLAQYTKIAYTGKTTGDSAGEDTTYSTIANAAAGAAVDVGPASGAGTAITNPTNAIGDDGNYATVTSTGATSRGLLWMHNFALFTTTGGSIPASATITGIKVTVERKADQNTANRYATDFTVRLTGVGSSNYLAQIPKVSAEDKAARNAYWPTADTVVTYGGANDLWGESSITPEQINSGDFGVIFGFTVEDSAGGTTASIDYIKVDVTYINATSQVYIWNASSSLAGTQTDIPIEVIKVAKVAGQYADSDAEAIITFKGPSHYVARIAGTDSSGLINGRQIAARDVLYSARGGTGTAYCTVYGPDYPVTLPAQAEMEAVESQYTWDVANFYATDGAETLFGANGAGPAFAWDGRYFILIHTELLPKYDKPRHVKRHGAHLALFYRQGIGLFSGITGSGPDPLYFETGVASVVAWEFGDRVHGISALADDVLAVFCQSKVVSLRGFTSDAFVEKMISPNSGAIEYTVVDMGFGNPVWLDNFGVSSLQTSQNFGDFEAGRLSADVWPWLQPRVQDNGQFIDQRPQCAFPVRNKNQYRVPFKDGYILTMTLVGSERMPMFTFQRYQDRRARNYADGAIYPIRAVTSDVWTDGRERVFFSMSYTESNTASVTGHSENKIRASVCEADVGTNFMGSPIQSFASFNWTAMIGPSQLKRFSSFWVYGAHSGYASFDVSRQINYVAPKLPASTAKRTTTVGDQSGNYEFDLKPFAVHVDFPVEGFNLSLRVDYYDQYSYGPIALQGISINADDRGRSHGIGTK